MSLTYERAHEHTNDHTNEFNERAYEQVEPSTLHAVLPCVIETLLTLHERNGFWKAQHSLKCLLDLEWLTALTPLPTQLQTLSPRAIDFQKHEAFKRVPGSTRILNKWYLNKIFTRFSVYKERPSRVWSFAVWCRVGIFFCLFVRSFALICFACWFVCFVGLFVLLVCLFCWFVCFVWLFVRPFVCFPCLLVCLLVGLFACLFDCLFL